jgi:hypothetical protein
MFDQISRRQGAISRLSPAFRGLRGLYRHDEVNHCPGCGRTHWLVGRFSAECGVCATALPLAETALLGVGTYICSGSPRSWGEWDVS